jgi:hypothetical protein
MTPVKLFNVKFEFSRLERPGASELDEDVNVFPQIIITDCFFIKRNGETVKTIKELESMLDIESGADLLVMKRTRGNIDNPTIELFDTYPELFESSDPDDPIFEVNTPYKFTSLTRRYLDKEVTVTTKSAGKRKSSTKKRKSKPLRDKKRRSSRKY